MTSEEKNNANGCVVHPESAMEYYENFLATQLNEYRRNNVLTVAATELAGMEGFEEIPELERELDTNPDMHEVLHENRMAVMNDIQRISKGGPSVFIHEHSLITLALFPDLRRAYVKAVSNSQAKYVHVTLQQFAILMRNLVRAQLAPTREQLALTTQEIREALSAARCVESVMIDDSSSSYWATAFALVGGCSRSIKLFADFKINSNRDPNMPVPAAGELISGFTSVETINIYNNNAKVFSLACNAMAELPVLKTCNIYHRLQKFRVAPDQAMAMRHMLESRSVESFLVDGLIFDSAEATEIVCQGLAITRVNRLSLGKLTFGDPAYAVAFARALAATPVVELQCHNVCSPSFWPTFGEALASDTCMIRKLCVTISANDDVIAFLNQVKKTKLNHLTLFMRDWTDSFDAALATFVREHKHIRSLSLDCFGSRTRVPTCPKVSSKALLAALDEGTRSLDQICLLESKFDAEWRELVDHYLELNLQRRLLDPLFATIAEEKNEYLRHARVLAVLRSMDLVVLSDFVRRNEWNLQALFKRWRELNAREVA